MFRIRPIAAKPTRSSRGNIIEPDNSFRKDDAMKTGHWTALVVGLAAVPGWFAPVQAAAPTAEWTVSGPFIHQNLAVYLLHGKDTYSGKKFLTLQEALERKQIIVHETGTVNELQIENVSAEFEVFIQAGDIVKGGRQDRVLAYDLIVPVESGKVSMSSFCVEAGRWQQRGGEDAGQFSQSTGQLPGKALRLAVRSARQQGQVWEKVKEQQDKLSRKLNKSVADARSPSSLQLTLENKELQAQVDAYVAKLKKCLSDKRDVVGLAVAINGNIEGAEVYGSSALLRKMWPKLLHAAAVDAFVERQKGRRYELVEPDEIRAFLAVKGEGKTTETKVNDRIRVTTRQDENGVCIETRDQEKKRALIHGS